MGVRDFSQVIKRYAPTAIKPIDSLSSLRNKTVAIDANLLTTKFHFAGKPLAVPLPSDNQDDGARQRLSEWTLKREQHRHVRGWYWLLKALDAHCIKPVVVFDGHTRIKAKLKEVNKRKSQRENLRLRGRAEGDRGERLRELREVWDKVERDDRLMVAQAFRAAAMRDAAAETRAAVVVGEARQGEEVGESVKVDESVESERVETVEEVGTFDKAENQLEPAIEDKQGDTATVGQTLQEPRQQMPEQTPEVQPSTASDERDATLLDAVKDSLRTPVTTISNLYASFVRDSTNPVYSRNQALLTHEERAFYDLMLRDGQEEGLELPDEVTTGQDEPDLSSIIAKSDELSTNYLWRSASVPSQAFKDTETLITALGIPCLRPRDDEPHEAEGVCSALYLHGLVDFVVSEDTDVAVYGAPLLRKISVMPQVTLTTTTVAIAAAAGASHSSEQVHTSDAQADLSDAQDIFESQRKLAPRPQDMMNLLDPEEIRQQLGLTKNQFVDFALLCGTDFTERIPSVGPSRALQLIKSHGSIEAALDAQTKYQPEDRDSYLESVRAGREIFLNPPPLNEALRIHTESSDNDMVNEDNERCQQVHVDHQVGSSLKLGRREPDANLPMLLRQWGIVDKELDDEFDFDNSVYAREAVSNTSRSEFRDEWLGVSLDVVDELDIVALEHALRWNVDSHAPSDVDEGAWHAFEREFQVDKVLSER
ncbi:hypothetical protein OIO90_003996 [Microbotryomycetes sp. JL221]|nr:hypothetical protein OIO90_003996 [Microbotryomycetes sp. JL221]